MSTYTSTERSLWDARMTARRLGLTTRAVRRFAHLGTIPVVRVGRYVRFDPEQIEKWIQAGGKALVGDRHKRADSES
jgi:excisionase family DNA binding protein